MQFGSHANNIYSPGSDTLTEVQLYMPTSCQTGSQVIRAFYDVEKPLLVMVWQLKSPNQKIKKGFSMSEKAWISSRVN